MSCVRYICMILTNFEMCVQVSFSFLGGGVKLPSIKFHEHPFISSPVLLHVWPDRWIE
jgi:hypothetical protein